MAKPRYEVSHADIAELPDEVKEVIEGPIEATDQILTNLERVLIDYREEAIKARKESGIEDVWKKAEEAYLGIDEANRSSFSGAKWAKPQSIQGPLTTGQTKPDSEIRSNAFVRLTSRYVDAGYAKVCEIVLPIDDKAFSFSGTPNPDLVKHQGNLSQLTHQGVPLTRPMTADELQASPGAQSQPQAGQQSLPPAAGTPGTQQRVPLTVDDLIDEELTTANACAKRAERRIYDWMVKSQYRAEMRKVVFDTARIGVGVLKGPFPEQRVRRGVTKGPNGKKILQLVDQIEPAYKWVDPWNVYPDGACGENIHFGDYVFELDFFTRKQLRRMKGRPGYLDKSIDEVLTLGPSKSLVYDTKPDAPQNKDRFPVWYFYGSVSKEMILSTGVVDEKEVTGEFVYAVVTLVNDKVIHAVINPLDSGEFPYHSVPWQRRVGHWAGVGVGEQLDMPQRLINAATRAMSNNAGRSAGSIVVIDRQAIVPADGNWMLTPDKIFFKVEESTVDDVRKAVTTFDIPNVTDMLMKIIEFAFRVAEESTSIPLVTQGQSGATTPDTYGATQLQNNNANQLLRSIAYAIDDFVTEPVINQSYEWLLLDDDVPDEEKGDWAIDAHGSASLVERAIQDQTVQAMAQWVENPRNPFGVDPMRWFAEFSKSKRLDPSKFQYSPEEKAKLDQTPVPPAPQVQVAQIRSQDAQARIKMEVELEDMRTQLAELLARVDAQTKTQIASQKSGVDMVRIKKEADRDTQYVQAQNLGNQIQSATDMRELEIKREIAILQYATQEKISLAQVKGQLANTQMTLQVQQQLSTMDNNVELHKHHTAPAEAPEVAKPAAEPAGKAPNGEAFEK